MLTAHGSVEIFYLHIQGRPKLTAVKEDLGYH
jgi:hypothetical protein